MMKLYTLIAPVILAVALTACGQKTAGTPVMPTDVNFKGVVTGEVSGPIAGPGYFKFLPTCGYERKGCHVLSDNTGIRDYMISITLPTDIAVKRYEISTPSPFDIGLTPSVRIEKDLGTSSHYFEKNAGGYVDLTSLPEKGTGGTVSGTYEISADDLEGKRVTSTGEFSFDVDASYYPQ